MSRKRWRRQRRDALGRWRKPTGAELCSDWKKGLALAQMEPMRIGPRLRARRCAQEVLAL